MTLSPHVGVIYFTENQAGYTDSNGVAIAGQTVSLGRLTFGPKVSVHYEGADGTVVTPSLSLKGIWDFEAADIVDLETGLAATGEEELRGRAEFNFGVQLPSGISILGDGFYNGIGARDYEAYGGGVKVTVPLYREGRAEASGGAR